MKRCRVAYFAFALGVGLGMAPIQAAEPIAPNQVVKLKALIEPGPGEEKWTEIPWLANLWDARKKAAAEGKPILLWEMDGNPLGCV